MFCSNCGTLNEDDARFCGGCGSQLICQSPIYASQTPTPPVYQPQPWVPAPPAYQSQPQPWVPTPSPYQSQPWTPAPVNPLPVYQSQPWHSVPNQAPVPGKGMGVAGMVLGIASMVFSAAWVLGVICALVGIVLSAVAMYKARQAGRNNGFALAGLICGGVGLALSVLFGSVAIEFFSGAFTDVGDIGSDYTTYM